jgi:hypothetical protein
MNRRNFFQALAASGIAAAIPLTLISEQVAQAKVGHQVLRSEISDVTDHYQYVKKLRVTVRKEGKSICGHTVTIADQKWIEMTKSQREELWARNEQFALNRLLRS